METDAVSLNAVVLRDAPRDVIDPKLGYNIVDLGLVDGLAIDGGIIDVTMTMTTPGRPAQDDIVAGIGTAAFTRAAVNKGPLGKS